MNTFNKYIYRQTINTHHNRKYKHKYDDYLNKKSAKHIKLDYKVEYNWNYELIRVTKFKYWCDLIYCINMFKSFIHIDGMESNYKPKIMPKEISCITNLQTLQYKNCKLTKIPKELVRLTNLRSLDLSGNDMRTISKKILKMPNIQILSLSSNVIKKIPKQIIKLVNLKELYLYNNIITKIPLELCHLTELEIIILYNNPIKSSPNKIGFLDESQIFYACYVIKKLIK